MRTNALKTLLVVVFVVACHTGEAAQKLISGVPNYDQDIFPIDRAYASIERGDCVPIACTMLHGYHDANGWPRLIPFGGNSVSQNAWGIDTAVRKYKVELNYTAGGVSGVYFSSWTWFLGLALGNKITAVVKYFEPNAAFSREDDDLTSWSRIQTYLNANRPCVLAVSPGLIYDPEYKWEGSSTINEIPGGHAVCAVGWSDVGGRWVMCNMGWNYTERAWFNYDGGGDWYISQITPGGSSSGEDDDAYEDNDTIGTARQISTGTISNLRCLDTLLSGSNYKGSWGDWYKVTASSGQTLRVTNSFTQANGDLDLRVYNPSQTEVGSSAGTGNSENVAVSATTAGSYYIFVYGYNNAKNQNYSLAVSLTTPTIAVTVQTSPSGRPFSVDGTTYSTAQTFNWTPGSSHTIATTSPQSGSAGVQYVFSSWSDGGAMSHTVSPTSGTTFTANFTTQYYLTMNAGTGGTVSPSSGWRNSGASVSIGAAPNSGYSFSGWTGSGSGSYSGSSSSSSVTMNAPITETASFTQGPISVTVQPNPSGRSFTVDGTAYTAAQTFNWTPGSSHTIATTSPQSGSAGVQYVFSSWSDGGAMSHTVSPTSGTTFTANFTTQYYLTMNAGTGGTVSPSSGWRNSGASVSIGAAPNSGYSFSGWTGSGSGSYSGSSSSSSVTMNAPITETASFACTYMLSSTSAEQGADSGAGSFNVTTFGSCSWVAIANQAWIHTTSSGNGNGLVNYTFDTNTSKAQRSGTISVGSQDFVINQSGEVWTWIETFDTGMGGWVNASPGSWTAYEGQLLLSNGTSGYKNVRSPHLVLLTNGFRMKMKLDTTLAGSSQVGVLFGAKADMSAGWRFSTSSGNDWGLSYQTPEASYGYASGTSPVFSQPHTLALDYDGQTLKCYVNEQLVHSESSWWTPKIGDGYVGVYAFVLGGSSSLDTVWFHSPTAELPVVLATKLGNDLVVSWSTKYGGFALEYATNLPAILWIPSPVSPSILNGQYTITNSISGGTRFYRLKQ